MGRSYKEAKNANAEEVADATTHNTTPHVTSPRHNRGDFLYKLVIGSGFIKEDTIEVA